MGVQEINPSVKQDIFRMALALQITPALRVKILRMLGEIYYNLYFAVRPDISSHEHLKNSILALQEAKNINALLNDPAMKETLDLLIKERMLEHGSDFR